MQTVGQHTYYSKGETEFVIELQLKSLRPLYEKLVSPLRFFNE